MQFRCLAMLACLIIFPFPNRRNLLRNTVTNESNEATTVGRRHSDLDRAHAAAQNRRQSIPPTSTGGLWDRMSGRFEFLYTLGFGSPDCERRQFHLIEKQRPLQYSRSANIQVNRTCSKGRESMDKGPRRTNYFGVIVEVIFAH